MITKSKFSPRWWLRNPHFQTIVASKLSNHQSVDAITQRLELADGDFIDLSWSKKNSGAFVCIFHGLAGSIDSAYAKSAFHALEANGFRPVFMHWRGCSGEPNRLSKSYHSGATEDIHTLVELIRASHPQIPVYAIAYSLGANALLKYLGEQQNQCQLSGAVCVCPPLVLNVGADKLNTGLTRVYQKYLLTAMRSQHEAKRRRYPELNLPAADSRLNTFWKFDNHLTAPLHGYKDVHDYYKKCSARQFLPLIHIPAHIIYALDDPFFTTAVVPEESELGPQVVLELTEHGGHVGFIGDSTQSDWLSKRICTVLQTQLKL